MKLKILLVIPTYNNAATIASVVTRALQTGYDVLVVNDGSTDRTRKIIDSFDIYSSRSIFQKSASSFEHKKGPPNFESSNTSGIVKIDHPENKGKGAAIITALKWAQENKYSHIITIDADGQHDPGDVTKFISKIKANPLSIIVGTRNFSNENVPQKSRFGRKFSNFWLKAACGTTVPDTQSGFRAYPVDSILKLKLHETRYCFEVEVLAKAVWAGLSLDSVDISVHYSDETKRDSHFKPFLDNFRFTKTYTKLVTRNFLPIPHRILYGKSHREKIINFFVNPIKVLKDLIKERASAKELTLAAMLGVFLGTFPLVGFHIISTLFCATRLKLNRLLAVNIQHFCAPPFVPAICIEAGHFVLNGKFLTEFNMQTLGHQFLYRVGEYFLGAIIMAPILSLIVGAIVYTLVSIIYWCRKTLT